MKANIEVLVEGAGELVERRGGLEALFEDAALALDADDLGQLDEPVEVLLGRQGTTYAELLRPLLERRVHHLVHNGVGALVGRHGLLRVPHVPPQHQSRPRSASCRPELSVSNQIQSVNQPALQFRMKFSEGTDSDLCCL